MPQEPVVIPEKIYFKIGEVCELVGVQAHVLRYWETEFPMLSPQKNASGQRSYRRRDVEIALRIKQLLYNEMFTIEKKKKKLQAEHREGSRPKPSPDEAGTQVAPTLFDDQLEEIEALASGSEGGLTARQREALRTLAKNLVELRQLLNSKPMRQ